MRLPLDPSHLEMPVNVVVAVAGSISSLLVAAWQLLGSTLAQIPTPDQVSGWQERDIYLCALIVFGATIAWMARWIAVKLLQRDQESMEIIRQNANSTMAVANALAAFTAKVDDLVVPAVTHAMHETFSNERRDTPMQALHSAAKRRRHEPNDSPP